jgi:hypothetical protein
MSNAVMKKPSHAGKHHHAPVPVWPSYRGTSQLVGTTTGGRLTVYVDPTLGQPALQNARDLVADGDRVMAENDAIFGAVGGAVNVIIFALDGQTDGTGGADHMGCDFKTGAAIEVCAAFGSPERVSALFEAELSECSMDNNLCGLSTGEGLSRWCASAVSNNALSDFATAPTWFQDGMPDFVNNTDQTDRNADSTGCTMAFLSWLLSQNFTLNQIATEMVSLGDAGTLAQLYEGLTGNPATSAFTSFIAAVRGLSGGITSDDPFGGAQNAPAAHLTPTTVAQATKIFGSILADLASGKAAPEIVANVHAILGSTSAKATGCCGQHSRRLRRPSKP